jgi:hypothetical protein
MATAVQCSPGTQILPTGGEKKTLAHAGDALPLTTENRAQTFQMLTFRLFQPTIVPKPQNLLVGLLPKLHTLSGTAKKKITDQPRLTSAGCATSY